MILFKNPSYTIKNLKLSRYEWMHDSSPSPSRNDEKNLLSVDYIFFTYFMVEMIND